MNTTQSAPETLFEAVQFYADLDVCHALMERIKWPDGKVTCPACGSQNIGRITTRRLYRCRAKECRKEFSAKVGTVFEDSPLPLSKWLVAVWSIVNAKNGISSCELGRALGVRQASAWFMLHRIRAAMQTGTFKKFAGEVESDETYIGGLAKNMHASRRKAAINGTGGAGKAIVHGLLERHGPKSKQGKKVSQVKAAVIPNVKMQTVAPILADSIQPGSHLYTDTGAAYERVRTDFIHERINHTEAFVRGNCHTNSLENFWSLFKRAVKGTYVSVDAPHLDRYVGEQVFRFNERDGSDADRFAAVMPGVVGKRLTYRSLTGCPLK